MRKPKKKVVMKKSSAPSKLAADKKRPDRTKKVAAPQSNGFDPTLYTIITRKESVVGESEPCWTARVVELPDVFVYHRTSFVGAYEEVKHIIKRLHEAHVQDHLPFPPPGWAPVDPKIKALREAFEFYDKARDSKQPDGIEVGAVKDGHEWVMKAARDLIG